MQLLEDELAPQRPCDRLLVPLVEAAVLTRADQKRVKRAHLDEVVLALAELLHYLKKAGEAVAGGDVPPRSGVQLGAASPPPLWNVIKRIHDSPERRFLKPREHAWTDVTQADRA